ncbi:hypothetical protein CSKR_102112 [Clonorchis sinensis]|uniref:Uncharacterized protein n=1 Tax=Clonorchis sinensis TaxID=79923 RepID=A0A419Q9V0_CLOSI|nr:hypothetical protein CSKR_102112 [Clonorchis sinensis]
MTPTLESHSVVQLKTVYWSTVASVITAPFTEDKNNGIRTMSEPFFTTETNLTRKILLSSSKTTSVLTLTPRRRTTTKSVPKTSSEKKRKKDPRHEYYRHRVAVISCSLQLNAGGVTKTLPWKVDHTKNIQPPPESYVVHLAVPAILKEAQRTAIVTVDGVSACVAHCRATIVDGVGCFPRLKHLLYLLYKYPFYD